MSNEPRFGTNQVSSRVDSELFYAVKTLARKTKATMSDILRIALRRLVDNSDFTELEKSIALEYAKQKRLRDENDRKRKRGMI